MKIFPLNKLYFRIPTPPKYILIENVKGFETSKTREALLQVLTGRNYDFEVKLFWEVSIWFVSYLTY